MNSENVAMIYLYAVEDEANHVDMAQDRFACGGDYIYPPGNPSMILAWMEDELEIQQGQHEAHPDEGRNDYIRILERDIVTLHGLGIEPNPRTFHRLTLSGDAPADQAN